MIGELQESINALKDCLRSDPDQKECKKRFRNLKKLNKKLEGVKDAVQKNKLITAKTFLINENLIQEIEKLGSKILNGQVYGYACKVFTEVNDLVQVLVEEK
jgi:DnaJ family protein C protein 3